MARGGLFDDFWTTFGVLSTELVFSACLVNVLRGARLHYRRGALSSVEPRMARGGLFDDFWMTFGVLSTELVLPACLADVLRGAILHC